MSESSSCNEWNAVFIREIEVLDNLLFWLEWSLWEQVDGGWNGEGRCNNLRIPQESQNATQVCRAEELLFPMTRNLQIGDDRQTSVE